MNESMGWRNSAAIVSFIGYGATVATLLVLKEPRRMCEKANQVMITRESMGATMIEAKDRAQENNPRQFYIDEKPDAYSEKPLLI